MVFFSFLSWLAFYPCSLCVFIFLIVSSKNYKLRLQYCMYSVYWIFANIYIYIYIYITSHVVYHFWLSSPVHAYLVIFLLLAFLNEMNLITFIHSIGKQELVSETWRTYLILWTYNKFFLEQKTHSQCPIFIF